MRKGNREERMKQKWRGEDDRENGQERMKQKEGNIRGNGKERMNEK